MTDRIARCFATCAAERRAALVTFITAGDPNVEQSTKILAGLAAAGADMIELGMPFTDPMADGPPIQSANKRALEAGISLKKIIAMVSAFRQVNTQTPLVLMGYINPILSYGARAFAQDAKAAGVDGVIIVDLPPEEDGEIGPVLRAAGIHIVRLATPTTSEARLPAVLEWASGFLYYVSMTGVTGAQDINTTSVAAEIARIKAHTDLPVVVGFGIKTPAQAGLAARVADGVVVGSALLSVIEQAITVQAPDVPDRVHRFVATLRDAVHTQENRQDQCA